MIFNYYLRSAADQKQSVFIASRVTPNCAPPSWEHLGEENIRDGAGIDTMAKIIAREATTFRAGTADISQSESLVKSRLKTWLITNQLALDTDIFEIDAYTYQPYEGAWSNLYLRVSAEEAYETVVAAIQQSNLRMGQALENNHVTMFGVAPGDNSLYTDTYGAAADTLRYFSAVLHPDHGIASWEELK